MANKPKRGAAVSGVDPAEPVLGAPRAKRLIPCMCLALLASYAADLERLADQLPAFVAGCD